MTYAWVKRTLIIHMPMKTVKRRFYAQHRQNSKKNHSPSALLIDQQRALKESKLSVDMSLQRYVDGILNGSESCCKSHLENTLLSPQRAIYWSYHQVDSVTQALMARSVYRSSLKALHVYKGGMSCCNSMQSIVLAQDQRSRGLKSACSSHISEVKTSTVALSALTVLQTIWRQGTGYMG